MNFLYWFLNLSTNSCTVQTCYFTILPHSIVDREHKAQISKKQKIEAGSNSKRMRRDNGAAFSEGMRECSLGLEYGVGAIATHN